MNRGYCVSLVNVEVVSVYSFRSIGIPIIKFNVSSLIIGLVLHVF